MTLLMRDQLNTKEGREQEHGMYQIILDNILRVLRIIWSRS